MTRRFQFSVKTLLVAMFVVAAFFTGAEFGARRERQRLVVERENVKSAARRIQQASEDLAKWQREVTDRAGKSR